MPETLPKLRTRRRVPVWILSRRAMASNNDIKFSVDRILNNASGNGGNATSGILHSIDSILNRSTSGIRHSMDSILARPSSSPIPHSVDSIPGRSVGNNSTGTTRGRSTDPVDRSQRRSVALRFQPFPGPSSDVSNDPTSATDANQQHSDGDAGCVNQDA